MEQNRIVITGGCGFIGSNFIRAISQNNNFHILNIDKLSYAGNLSTTKDFKDNKNYTFTQLDIKDRNKVEKEIMNFKPNFIINFAAESHVDRSIDSSLDFINTNIIGTFNLLEIIRLYLKQKNIPNFRFLHISTDEVFGSIELDHKFTEFSPYSPSSPYSASKASSDHLVRAWHKTYNLPVIITNCSNNYGPFQFPEKLVPITIINALLNKTINVYGDGQQIRDWIHVNDHIEALQEILFNGKIGETYNIGGINEIKNIDLVNKVCEILDHLRPLSNSNTYKDQIEFVTDRPGHDLRYAIDISKIKNDLKWYPKTKFDSGLLDTVKWYLNNFEWCEEVTLGKYDFERLGKI